MKPESGLSRRALDISGLADTQKSIGYRLADKDMVFRKAQ